MGERAVECDPCELDCAAERSASTLEALAPHRETCFRSWLKKWQQWLNDFTKNCHRNRILLLKWQYIIYICFYIAPLQQIAINACVNGASSALFNNWLNCFAFTALTFEALVKKVDTIAFLCIFIVFIHHLPCDKKSLSVQLKPLIGYSLFCPFDCN